MGFHKARDEAIRYLVDVMGHNPAEQLCANLVNHLQKQFAKHIDARKFQQLDSMFYVF